MDLLLRLMENRELLLQVQLFQGPTGRSFSFSTGPDVTTTVSHGKKQSLKKMAKMVACSKGASKNLEDPEAPLLKKRFQEGPKMVIRMGDHLILIFQNF